MMILFHDSKVLADWEEETCLRVFGKDLWKDILAERHPGITASAESNEEVYRILQNPPAIGWEVIDDEEPSFYSQENSRRPT